MAASNPAEATQTTQTNSSQSQPAAPSLQTMLFGGPNGIMLIALLFGLVFVWFFGGKKQKKREQEEIAIRKNVEIGDELTTTGGIVGIVVAVKDDVFTLETGSDRSKLRIEKWAIKSNVTAAARRANQKEIEKNERKGRLAK
ncbi:hypothetical protein FACS1894198_1010 [Clostridia bacterium]|nr:hypothetical protein FACS1894198_1010 [Clostridia bacterium]